jgi:hypothetical protein
MLTAVHQNAGMIDIDKMAEVAASFISHLFTVWSGCTGCEDMVQEQSCLGYNGVTNDKT